MKKALLAVLLLPLSCPAVAGTIPAKDASAYIGQSVTVVGRASVDRMPSGEIYLDLEGKGDGAPISCYVSRWNTGSFPDIAHFDGKLVAVSGEIGSFRDRPEIFLTAPGQIAVVEPPANVEASPLPLQLHIAPRGK